MGKYAEECNAVHNYYKQIIVPGLIMTSIMINKQSSVDNDSKSFLLERR